MKIRFGLMDASDLSRLKPIIKIRKPLAVDSGVFPAVAVVADVPQADRCVGYDREAALSGPVAEGVVLGQEP